MLHRSVGLSHRPPGSVRTTPSPAVLAAWRSADAVCFDVDSTFCVDESIDEIAAFLGKGPAVAALTRRAMGEGLDFRTALERRLALMAPSRADLDAFLAAHPPRLSPGIPELVARIQGRGAEVWLVSGGFREVIGGPRGVAAAAGVPPDRVFANRLRFDPATGAYAGFDPDEPTSRSGGKADAARAVAAAVAARRGGGLRPADVVVVAVGDGATDLEARAPGAAAAVVGYGGVAAREAVARGADWFVSDFGPLLAALDDDGGGGGA